MAATADKTKPYFPLNGLANDGYSNENEATATCFCGAVQLAFVSVAKTLLTLFNTDPRISHFGALASMAHLSVTVQTVAKSPHQCLRRISL